MRWNSTIANQRPESGAFTMKVKGHSCCLFRTSVASQSSRWQLRELWMEYSEQCFPCDRQIRQEHVDTSVGCLQSKYFCLFIEFWSAWISLAWRLSLSWEEMTEHFSNAFDSLAAPLGNKNAWIIYSNALSMANSLNQNNSKKISLTSRAFLCSKSPSYPTIQSKSISTMNNHLPWLHNFR